LPVAEAAAGAWERSRGGSSCPERGGQGEKGAPAGWLGLLGLSGSGGGDGMCGLVPFIYLFAF